MADFSDLFSQYLGNRANTDMNRVGAGDTNTQANVTPTSTTINYNQDGSQDITHKMNVAPIPAAAVNNQPEAATPPAPVAGPVAPQAPAMPPQAPVGQPPVGQTPPMPQGPVAPQAPAMPLQAPVGQIPPMPQGQGPVAPQAPAMPPQAPVGQGPVNPATPPAPAPAPAPAEAPAPTSTAESLPGVQAQPHVDLLMASQNNPAMLTKLQQDQEAPDFVRQAAAKQLHSHLTDFQGQIDAKREGDRLLEQANAGDPKASKQLANVMSSAPKEDEGSYLKAYLLHRFGLSELSKQEQIKLGAGSTMNHVTLPDGTSAVIRQRADGVATYGVDSEGNQLNQKQLSDASGAYQKGAVTGQTFGKDASGHVISHTIMPNGAGVVWKDETTGQKLTSAPAGYQSMGQKSLEQLEAEKSITTGAARERQMRKANQDAQLMGLPAPYSETAIQAEKNKITPGAGGSSIGSDLSQGLQGKIVSANRNPDQQKALWDESVAAGRPGKTASGMPVAQPGTSQHQFNNALDLPKVLSADERRELAQKGYFQPYGVDSVHWEKATPETQGAAAPATTSPAVTAPGHVPTMAEKIANYEMKPPASRSAMYGPLMAEVNRVNPEYDETKYPTIQQARKNFTTGKQGDTVRSMNVAIDHLDTLDEAAKALNNGDLPLFNKITNDYSRNTGSPAVTNFDGIKSIVGSEVAKAVSGAGGSALGDREEIRREIDNANSPQQLAGVIKKYQQLMGGQLNGLRTQYEDTGLKDFDKKLTPRTKQVLSGAGNTESNHTRSSW